MLEKYKEDYKQMTSRSWTHVGGVLRTVKHRNLRVCFFGRLAASNILLFSRVGRWIKKHYENRYGLEIDYKNVDGGLLLLHPFNITVNSRAHVGKNCTLFKGCTIGSVRSGKREGVPTIGDRVVFCVNSTVVGNVHIGNDVLIAANSMVDFDVPDNSIVFGNPGQIKHKDQASKDYMTGL